MSLEWFIARRYLASRRGAGFLSLITLIAIGGVFVGVMALIVVTSVMTGLQNDLREKILGTNPHVWVSTFGQEMRVDAGSWEGALERIRTVPGVVSAAPFVHAEVAITSNGYAEAGILRGIDPAAEGTPVTDMTGRIRSGEYPLGETVSGFPPLLMGEGLAAVFAVGPGQVVSLIGFQDVRINQMGSFSPPMRKFEVVGTFRTGMYEYDNRYMYTNLAGAQDLTGLDQAVTGLEVRVEDPLESDAVAARIEGELGFPYRAEDWKSDNRSLFSALQLEKFAMGIILLLIVIVAAFNIISTLVMVVADKTREIGILKSMGLKSSQVQRVFMYQGIVIGLVGSVLGTIAGLVLIYVLDKTQLIKIPGDIYFVDHLPVAYNVEDIAIILFASLLISFGATIYPARQAAKLYPVDAIRHE